MSTNSRFDFIMFVFVRPHPSFVSNHETLLALWGCVSWCLYKEVQSHGISDFAPSGACIAQQSVVVYFVARIRKVSVMTSLTCSQWSLHIIYYSKPLLPVERVYCFIHFIFMFRGHLVKQLVRLTCGALQCAHFVEFFCFAFHCAEACRQISRW